MFGFGFSWIEFLGMLFQAVNAVALVRCGASQSLLDLDGVLRVMKDPDAHRCLVQKKNGGLRGCLMPCSTRCFMMFDENPTIPHCLCLP